MAFNMNPGRSPFLKTGHGLPSAFLQQKNPISGFSTKEDAEIAANEELKIQKENSLKENPLGGSDDVRNFNVAKDYTIAAKEKVTKFVKPGTEAYKKWEAAVKNNPSVEDKFKSSKGTVSVSDKLAGQNKPSVTTPTPKSNGLNWTNEEVKQTFGGFKTTGLSSDASEMKAGDVKNIGDKYNGPKLNMRGQTNSAQNIYEHKPVTDQEKKIIDDGRFGVSGISPYDTRWQKPGGESKRLEALNVISGKIKKAEETVKTRALTAKASQAAAIKAKEEKAAANKAKRVVKTPATQLKKHKK